MREDDSLGRGVWREVNRDLYLLPFLHSDWVSLTVIASAALSIQGLIANITVCSRIALSYQHLLPVQSVGLKVNPRDLEKTLSILFHPKLEIFCKILGFTQARALLDEAFQGSMLEYYLVFYF